MSGRLDGRLIGLGITGSIAAYKAPELVRALQAEGADVVALLTSELVTNAILHAHSDIELSVSAGR